MTEYILFAAPDDEQGTQDAIEYARKNKLTRPDARVYKYKGQVLVAVTGIPDFARGTWLENALMRHLES